VVSEATDLPHGAQRAADAKTSTSRPRPRSCPRWRSRLDEESARKVFRLIDAIEDSDDVQDVYANYSVSDDVMERIG